MEDLAKQQNSKLDSFKTKVLLIQCNHKTNHEYLYLLQIEILVRENEELRESQLQSIGPSAAPSAGHSHGPSLAPSGPVGAELVAELTEQIDVLHHEVALLVEQKSALSSELDQQQQLLRQGDKGFSLYLYLHVRLSVMWWGCG